MNNEIDWLRINCIHAGHLEAAEDLENKHHEGGLWLLRKMVREVIMPYKRIVITGLSLWIIFN